MVAVISDLTRQSGRPHEGNPRACLVAHQALLEGFLLDTPVNSTRQAPATTFLCLLALGPADLNLTTTGRKLRSYV